MTVKPTFPTKQDVVRALSGLYVNRSKRDGFRHVRSILRQFGNGVSAIGELDPAYYESVWRAAGGSMSAEEIYGNVTDAPVIDATQPAKITIAPVAPRTSPSPPSRIRSPLVAELEAQLAAAKAKTKRSVPNYVVNTGNASRAGDQADDAPQPEYPARMEKLS